MFRLFGISRMPASVNDSFTGTPLQPMQPGASMAGHLQVPAASIRTNAPYVSRKLRTKEHILYARGVVQQNVFHMTQTGGVESSLANTQSGRAGIVNGFFNDALFEAGYPRNTGISVKLEQVNADLKRGNGPRMTPQPQMRSSILTRRAFYGAPIKPAKPAAS